MDSRGNPQTPHTTYGLFLFRTPKIVVKLICRKWSTYRDSWIHRTFPRKRYKDQTDCTGRQVQPRLTGEDPLIICVTSCSSGRSPAASPIISCLPPPPFFVSRLAYNLTPLFHRLPFFRNQFSFSSTLVAFSKVCLFLLSFSVWRTIQRTGEALILSVLGVCSAPFAVVCDWVKPPL